jgi:hypothetical protein
MGSDITASLQRRPPAITTSGAAEQGSNCQLWQGLKWPESRSWLAAKRAAWRADCQEVGEAPAVLESKWRLSASMRRTTRTSFAAGVIDPTEVVRTALQGAASVAGLLVTTKAMVAEHPKKDSPMPMPPGGAWRHGLPVRVGHREKGRGGKPRPFSVILSWQNCPSGLCSDRMLRRRCRPATAAGWDHFDHCLDLWAVRSRHAVGR